MKKLFFTFLFNSILAIGFSQTNVSGIYFSNLTWNISGSPYNITGDVQIPTNVILTIDPGVQINFNGDYELLIKGSLNAVGTSVLPIKFNGTTSGKAMIMYKSTNLSLSKLSYIQFIGPKNSLQLADESEFNEDVLKNTGVLTVSNISLSNTTIQTKGYLTKASLVLDNVTATETTIKGVYPNSEPIEINNSNFNNCIIFSDAYNAGITLRNSHVTDSDLIIECCGANFNIISSVLESSPINKNGNPSEGPLKISDSKLENSPINLPNATVEIKSSVITYESSNGIILGNGSIQCTKINGNGSGTALTITGIYSNSLAGSVNIHKSHIAQNSIGIKIIDIIHLTIDSSNFESNSLYNIENSSNKNINATKNWWDSVDPLTILNKNFDYYDNINYGVINTSNILTSANFNQNCLDLITSTKENNNQTSSSIEINIFPNPASNLVNLFFENLNNSEDLNIEIVNTIGQQYYLGQISSSTKTQIIDISQYPQGVYFCNFLNGQNHITKKIIIQ